MEVMYRSIFKDDIASFLDIYKLSKPSDKEYKAYKSTLSDFDSFLVIEGLAEKKIDEDLIKRWLDGFDVHQRTKKSKLSRIRRFAGYLFTLDIQVDLPELPRVTSDFAPYVFTKEEMAQMFDMADDLALTSPNSRVVAEFPVLLRILYGCGLRLGEATPLTWDDVDLDSGVITVRMAKNQKQRLVPMGVELTRILKLYRTSPCYEMEEHGFLFKTDEGKPRTLGAYWKVFSTILCELGIKNLQTAKYGSRGPCIHSLRHTFTINSLLKAESEGRDFMETVPFLSTYLGHESLMQTDVYLKARHELYTEAHAIIEDYTQGVFPDDEVCDE